MLHEKNVVNKQRNINIKNVSPLLEHTNLNYSFGNTSEPMDIRSQKVNKEVMDN